MGKGMPLTWSAVKSVRLIFSSRPDQEAPPKTRFMPLPRSRTFGRRWGEMVRGVGRIGMGHLFLGGMAAEVCGHYENDETNPGWPQGSAATTTKSYAYIMPWEGKAVKMGFV